MYRNALKEGRMDCTLRQIFAAKGEKYTSKVAADNLLVLRKHIILSEHVIRCH